MCDLGGKIVTMQVI